MESKNEKMVRLTKVLMKKVRKQYPDEADQIISEALKINRQLCKENADQPEKVKVHTFEKIYPSISFYKSMLQFRGDKEEAYQLISTTFNKYAKGLNRVLKVLCRIPFVYKLVPGIMRRTIHNTFGTKSGFEMIDRAEERNKCHIDMKVCPYYSSCVKYGCKELGTSFCNSDDISYGNMHPKLFWGRTKTLARGNDCCDFILEIRTKR